MMNFLKRKTYYALGIPTGQLFPFVPSNIPCSALTRATASLLYRNTICTTANLSFSCYYPHPTQFLCTRDGITKPIDVEWSQRGIDKPADVVPVYLYHNV